MYKQHYSRFLKGTQEKLFFTAHSHHFWPDVTRDAMLRYWDDSARMADNKWDHVFGEEVAKASCSIANILGLESSSQVVFGTNTHELLVRLFSSIENDSPLKVLTTDGEFHSFSRQVRRWEEAGRVNVTRVASEPVRGFGDRVLAELSEETFDILFLSHVFFNSGCVVDGLAELVKQVPGEVLVVVDGYHGFCAVPTDLSDIHDRVFYLAGGYKYAQAGEACCFMTVPVGCSLRPVNTGWFADFAGLSGEQTGAVGYSDNAMRFAGATFDPSGIYRFNSVMALWEAEGIDVEQVHGYIRQLQELFLQLVGNVETRLTRAKLLFDSARNHGHFVTYDLGDSQATAEYAEALDQAGVHTDYRGSRIRFGFGMQHDEGDVRRCVEIIKEVG